MFFRTNSVERVRIRGIDGALICPGNITAGSVTENNHSVVLNNDTRLWAPPDNSVSTA